MKTLILNNDLILQNYGAAELKAYSGKATFRAFGITMLLFGLVFLLFYITKTESIPVPNTIVTIADPFEFIVPAQPINTIKQTYEIKMPQDATVNTTGTVKVEGNYIPAKDNSQAIETSNIASAKDAGLSLPTLGTANSFKEIKTPGNGNGIGINNGQQSTVPAMIEDDGNFPIYEKEPEVDMINLQKNLVYPEIPRKAGIDGRVIVRVLIGADGSVLKSKIDMSDNSLLDEAALKAVMAPGIFKPAIQNKQPVQCWVSIPINFRLR